MNNNDIKPLKKLLDNVREIEGFPLAEDDDILELSKPPYFTLCPNPYIEDFLKECSEDYNSKKDFYDNGPFLSDVSEGRNDPLYYTHTYHTKVPYKAIMKFIKHYTSPRDVIYDGFCGSGMTGIASQILDRNVILSDLCPIAAFIAYNYNKLFKEKDWEKILLGLLEEVKLECNWMYETNHSNFKSKSPSSLDKFISKKNKNEKGEINYIIWSDLLVCPYCSNEYNYWNASIEIDQHFKNFNNKKNYLCPHCNAELNKRDCEIAKEIIIDHNINKEITQLKQEPVLIDYNFGRERFWKLPDEDDFDLISKIQEMTIPYWFPTNRMPEGDESRRNDKSGLTHVHHFYTKRNLWILAHLWDKANTHLERFLITSILVKTASRFHNVGFKKNRINLAGKVSGTLYLPSITAERNIFFLMERKMRDLNNLIEMDYNGNAIITTQSTSELSNIPNNIIDYIFIDPPFGENLMYSELSFIWESWLKVYTNNKSEVIINKSQNKDLSTYTKLMTECLKEMFRILKPNRWITIEFHNSKASVWNAIQQSINKAGFIIAQVAILDKQQGTFKQQTAPGTVKSDLVINAYKPSEKFTERFLINAGVDMELEFIKQQLEHLPIKTNIERTEKMLYSKMLAHYVENGFKIQYNSMEFYQLLMDNFIELDGYWFLNKQVKNYNDWKSNLNLDQLKNIREGQQILLISDENSALTWIQNFLTVPKEYSEIYTAYNQLSMKSKDKIPELKDILKNNFIFERGKYRKPRTNEEKDKIMKSREKELKSAFEKLKNRAMNQKRKIKSVRKEAIVYGFTKLYKNGKYEEILKIANRFYKSTLESIGEIMDFVDIAKIKTEGQKDL